MATVLKANETNAPTTEKLFSRIMLLMPAITNAPTELKLTKSDTIVAIGDSITWYGGYLRYVEQVITANYPELSGFKIINAGISGDVAAGVMNRFQRDVIERKPTIVLINIGVNDVGGPGRLTDLSDRTIAVPHDLAVLKAYRNNLAHMVDLAQNAGIRVILLSPTIFGEDPNTPGNLRMPFYAHAMSDIAEEKKCQFVDLHAMFLSVLRRKPAGQTGNWLTIDGVHMRPLGDAVMALGVLRALGVPNKQIFATEIAIAP